MARLGDKFSDEQKRKLGYNERKNTRSERETQNKGEEQKYEFPWGINPFEGDSVILVLGKMKAIKIEEKKNKKKVKEKLVPYGDTKIGYLKDVIEFYNNKSRFLSQILKTRINTLKKANFKTMRFKLAKKLIVGLGNPSALETGITLHHIYGFPYIPASSIKGVVRDTALRKMFPNHKDYEELDRELSKLDIDEAPENEKTFIRIFGSQKYKGEVMFADMLPDPSDFPELDIDIINVHYRKYYSDLYSGRKNIEWKEEYERDNPNPILFLIVKDGAFIFFYKSPKDLEDEVEKFIKSALTDHGIGSKTRFGYGFFDQI